MIHFELGRAAAITSTSRQWVRRCAGGAALEWRCARAKGHAMLVACPSLQSVAIGLALCCAYVQTYRSSTGVVIACTEVSEMRYLQFDKCAGN